MSHTSVEIQVMKDYQKSIDPDILDFINNFPRTSTAYITVGFLSEAAANEIQSLTGMAVFGNRILLDKNGVQHIEKRHGVHGEQDQSMKEVNDIARIGYVLANYDTIEFHNEYAQGYVDSNGHLAPKVIFSKRIDGTYYVIEACSDSKRKRNFIVSAYITPAKKESNPSVPDNAYAPGLRPKRS